MRDMAAPGTPPRRHRLAAVVLAAAALVGATTALEAQSRAPFPAAGQTGMRPRPPGIGLGGAIGLGFGLGILGRSVAEPVPESVGPEPRRRPPPGRLPAVEDDDAPPRPPARTVQRPPPPAIAMPRAGENRYVPGDVLVELRPGTTIAPLAARLGLNVLESQAIRLTGTTVHRLRARDGRSTTAVLTRLQREPSVARAQPDWLYTVQQAAPPAAETAGDAEVAAAPVPPPAVAPLPGQYAAAKLRLAGAHDRALGRGVLVALIDTGVDAGHPELAGAIEASFDALDGVDPAAAAHGTAMAGAIAARSRLAGAAPAARLLVARAFGRPGGDGAAQGSSLGVLRCLDWSVGRGARVVSMSFAGPGDALMGRALAAARAKGVVAVAAAGNAGAKSPPLYPAAEPGVVAVTASDADDRVLPTANRGAHVTATAPGVDILVPVPDGGYDVTTGTSVAAAEVAGVVALLLEARGDLKPDEVRRLLVDTAIDLGPAGRDPTYGAGLIDAAAAVARLR